MKQSHILSKIFRVLRVGFVGHAEGVPSRSKLIRGLIHLSGL